MGLLLILSVLTFSTDWAKWGDYVKPPSEQKQDGDVYYYDKPYGCRKGYYQNGTESCAKCKTKKDDEIGGFDDGGLPVACKDYKGTDGDIEIGCYCKDKKWRAGSCPGVVKAYKYNHKDDDDDDKKQVEEQIKLLKNHKKFGAAYAKQCMFQGCMPYNSKARCSGVAVWAFIVIVVVAVLVVVAIVVVIIVVILKLRGGKPTTKVDPAPAAESKSAAAPAAEAPPPEVVGPTVSIKLGKQEISTKKAADGPTAVWGETVVFTGLGAEDDDVIIEVKGNGGEVLGTADQRIPEYVNNKKRAVLTLKNGEADAGVLEVDIEIQVQEEPEVKITGVFFVDKYTKPV